MYDILIVGEGPAGLTSAIYASRGGKKVGIVVGLDRGGQIIQTAKLENYSGILEVDGYTITATMREQAEKFGTEFIDGYATKFDLSGEIKSVFVEGVGEIKAKAVIIAMGTRPRKLEIANEDKLIGQGVSFCATCDGGFFRDRTVTIVGGGNTAVTTALYMENIAKEVYLVHRRREFRATQVLVDRLKQSSVNILLDSNVIELGGEPLEIIKIKNAVTGKVTEFKTDGLFINIGSDPNTELLQGQIELDSDGYILTDEHMRTSCKNVYAAGDIRNTPLRQVITACANGAIAAETALQDIL